MGLNREQALGVHAAGLADQLVRLPDCADLADLCQSLGVSPEALDAPTAATPAGVLCAGDSVAFTGSMSREREEYFELARAAGLVPHLSVRSDTTYLVAADPDSLSGKARKAHARGIPIHGEQAFIQMLSMVGPARTTCDPLPGSAAPTVAAAPGSVERLICRTCGEHFERVTSRGRKPHSCPSCREDPR